MPRPGPLYEGKKIFCMGCQVRTGFTICPPPLKMTGGGDKNNGKLGVHVFSRQDTYGPQHKKTCLRGLGNNTGADQPAHPRSLISAFVICVWKVPSLSMLQTKFQFSS